MDIRINKKSLVVFDLDDTLYREIDFVRSGLKHVANMVLKEEADSAYERMFKKFQQKEKPFDWLLSSYPDVKPPLSLQSLLDLYRTHTPNIRLNEGVLLMMEKIKQATFKVGLITDGRSNTQRAKLKALGLESYFDDIIISEEFGTCKPHVNNYLYYSEKYPGLTYWYIGDNLEKDFIVPLAHGWKTICVRGGEENIHPQDFSKQSGIDYIVNSIEEIEFLRLL
jgi:putative hydrolase of the HAD superfamily